LYLYKRRGQYAPLGHAPLAEALYLFGNNHSKEKAMGIAARIYVVEHFCGNNQAQASFVLSSLLCQKD